MRPQLPGEDEPDGTFGDAEVGREINVADTALLIPPSDLPHLILSEARLPVPGTPRCGLRLGVARVPLAAGHPLRLRVPAIAEPDGRPPLRVTIGGVVGRSPEPEMLGIDARWVVARVTDEESVRNWPDQEFIGEAVSVDGLPGLIAEGAIPIDLAAGPEPASVRLLNFRPEALNRGAALGLSVAPERAELPSRVIFPEEGSAAVRTGTLNWHRKLTLSGVYPSSRGNDGGVFFRFSITGERAA